MKRIAAITLATVMLNSVAFGENEDATDQHPDYFGRNSGIEYNDAGHPDRNLIPPCYTDGQCEYLFACRTDSDCEKREAEIRQQMER